MDYRLAHHSPEHDVPETTPTDGQAGMECMDSNPGPECARQILQVVSWGCAQWVRLSPQARHSPHPESQESLDGGTLQPLKCFRNTDHLQVFRIGDAQSEPEFCMRFDNLN